MAKNTAARPTNFPEFPLPVTGQRRPSSARAGTAGSSKTVLVSGRKVTGGS